MIFRPPADIVERNDLLPISATALGNQRIFFAPRASFELAEPLGGGLSGFGPVDGSELASQGWRSFQPQKDRHSGLDARCGCTLANGKPW